MSVQLTAQGTIRLEGTCPIDDAEPLLRLLLSHRKAAIDWRACEQAHSAVVQVLLALRPPILGPSASAFLQHHVAPLLAGGPPANASTTA